MSNRLLSLTDLTHMPQPQWLVEGLFERASLVMLAGPSYSFKSFLLLDWLLCMAAGRKWNNRVTQTCKIVYMLGEGKSSLIKRIQAWLIHNKLTAEERARLDSNFRVTFEVAQLASKASTDNFLADLEAEGFKPDVVAIDTLARSIVGLDENNQKDMGLWVESADRLRQLGYGVVFLHHTKRNTEFGVQYRGSSAIMGAMDTAMTLVRKESTCTLTVTKQKDHDEGPDLTFSRLIIPISSGDKSCVLVPMMSAMDLQIIKPVGEPEEWSAREVHDLMLQLVKDESFTTDVERAEILSNETGLSLIAAQSRISRHRNPKEGK